MEANLSLGEAPYIEEVARRNLVTLLTVTNSRGDQSVDQSINRRSGGTLLGCLGNISPPSMAPYLQVLILLWWISNTAFKISI